MKHEWEVKKLRSLVDRSELLEIPTLGKAYKQVGIQLWGKGAYGREEIDGSETQYKYFNKLKAGDLVINKIWARNGATAVVFDEFEDHYVSTEFPVFHIKKTLLEPKWASFATQQKWFWDACNEQAFGTSGKNRIKPEKFLEITIPLPPLGEQKRIVAKIESIRQRIEEIRNLRREQEHELATLLFSRYTETIAVAEWLPMREVAPIIRRDVSIVEHELYPELGIRSFGRGTFHKPALTGIEVGTKKIYQIKTGDLLFSNVFAWEGAIAIAKEEDNDRYGSHRFISCVVKEGILAEFLGYHFLTSKGMEDIISASPGGAGRNKTLGLEKLMRIKVPIPTLSIQEEFVTLIHKVRTIREQYADQEKELSELVPGLLDKAFKGEL